MGLLNKQNKEEVMKLNCISGVTIFGRNQSLKDDILKSKVDDFIHANLLKILTDGDYTRRQLHTIWSDVTGNYDVNNFTVVRDDFGNRRFYLQVLRKINDRINYILNAHFELDEDSYEIYNQLCHGTVK